jgi:histidinol-phosphate/aromatic aminotransferase/cobyric acid decarboxylase-like protein
VVNPNNPTGLTVSAERILAFARERPPVLVIVDESYADFHDGVAVQQLLQGEPLENVAILKSLSKSLGVPGARLGYTYSINRGFNAAFDRLLPVWQIGSIAEFLLEICLKHRRELTASYEDTRRDRAAFAVGLAKLPGIHRVHPSGGNFLLVELEGSAEVAAGICRRLMAERRICLKNVSAKMGGRGGFLRLAVRLPGENQQLCAALAEFLPSAQG